MLGLDQQLHCDSFAFRFALASQRSSDQTLACKAVHKLEPAEGWAAMRWCNVPVGVHAVSLDQTRTWLFSNALCR